MTTRWVLTDPTTSETWTMPINPDSMTSPLQERNLDTSYAMRSGIHRLRTFVTPSSAAEWQWGGVIRTKDHHDTLLAWSKKAGKVHVTDHLGRTFEVMFESFEPTDRKPTAKVPWRLRYIMKALVLRRLA